MLKLYQCVYRKKTFPALYLPVPHHTADTNKNETVCCISVTVQSMPHNPTKEARYGNQKRKSRNCYECNQLFFCQIKPNVSCFAETSHVRCSVERTQKAGKALSKGICRYDERHPEYDHQLGS